MEPEHVLFLGNLEADNHASVQVLIPAEFLNAPDGVLINEELIRPFFIPVSALGRHRTEPLLSDAYRSYEKTATGLRYATLSFALLSLLLLGSAGFGFARNQALSAELRALRAENGRPHIL